MQYGMPTLIGNRTLEDNIRLCARLGLRFIELNMNFPEYQLDFLRNTGALLEAGTQNGIYFTIHLDENLDIADLNPLVRQAYLETVRRSIEAAKALTALRDRFGDPRQALTLNMHMAHGVHITLPDRKVDLYARDFDTYMRNIKAFRGLAGDWIGGSDVMIVIENTDGFRDHEKKAVECLLESPVFGLTWDIGHSKATGDRDVPFILEHGDQLIHFHIHDGTDIPPRDHLALGDGAVDLKARIALARERNARCVLETKTAEALKKSVDWLKANGLFS